MTEELWPALVLAGLFLLPVLFLLRHVLFWAVKLALRTGVGLAVLSLLRAFGGVLGVNFFNALVLGLLGVPGYGLLLLLNWACR